MSATPCNCGAEWSRWFKACCAARPWGYFGGPLGCARGDRELEAVFGWPADGDLVHQKRDTSSFRGGHGRPDRAKTENRTIYSRTYG